MERALSSRTIVYFLKNINYIKNYIKKVISGREFVRKELKKININVFGKKSNCLLVKFNSSNQYSKIIKALDDNKIYVKSGEIKVMYCQLDKDEKDIMEIPNHKVISPK